MSILDKVRTSMPGSSYNGNFPPQIVNIVDQAPKTHKLRTAAIAIGLGSATILGVLKVIDSFGGIGELWDRYGLGEVTAPVIGEQPDTAHAAIRPDTYETREFKTGCFAKTSAGVAVDAYENGTTGRIRIKDIRWVSFLACGQGAEAANISTQVLLQKNADNKIVKVTYNGPGLLATQARVELTDHRNCVNLDPDDTKEKIDTKILKYDEDEAAGKNPKCDMGTDQTLRDRLTYNKIGGPISSLPDTVNVAVQLAGEAYGSVSTAANRFNVEYKEQFKSALVAEYPEALVEVNFSEDETMKAQENAAKEDLIKNNYTVAPIINNKTGKLEAGMVVTSKGGDVVTVRPRGVESGSLKLTSPGN